jgi:hypothetical protein
VLRPYGVRTNRRRAQVQPTAETCGSLRQAWHEHPRTTARHATACRGKLIYDLATAVNALCFVEDRYQIDRFEALITGYESLRPLSLPEWDSFPNELRFSALRFTVTRIKDFYLKKMDESLRVHKDYKEFYDRLLILRREKSGGMEDILLAMATGYDYRKYQKSKPAK